MNEIDKVLCDLNSKVDFNFLYPRNVEKERSRFFEDPSYSPIFKYSQPNIDFEECYKKLGKLKFGNLVMDEIFKEKAKEIYNLLKLIENIGSQDFTKYSKILFGFPDKELVSLSRSIISKNQGKILKSKGSISSKLAIQKFKEIFDNLNLNWEVVERDIASKAVVMPNKRRLVIKKNRFFTNKEIERFIVHEIYTHILRTEFGLRQPYKIFSTGFANYLETEEGLALYKEKRAGVLKESQLKDYAARVIAIDIALKSSFREVYNFLAKYFSKEVSWDISVRVKRGISNSSKKGAFTKDLVYLRGYYLVEEFVKNQSCLHLLHYGKIGINDALKIPLIENLKNPYVLLKKHFKDNIKDLSILY